MGERLLTVREVAERLKCSTDLIYDLIREGVLEAVDLNAGRASRRMLRVPEAALRRIHPTPRTGRPRAGGRPESR